MRRILFLLTVIGAIVIGAPTAQASTYGWRWAETVEVFDATGSVNAQVPEAVREWNRGDVTIVMTTNRAAANVVVEVREGICGAGCAYFPTITNGVATGTCYATMLPGVAAHPMAEHVALHEIGHCIGLAHAPSGTKSIMVPTVSASDFRSRPTRYDYADVNRLY